ncbi:Rid family hydrolase [Acinetobacter boissieri]|uniref:Enamine deaminase RidA, house cleaning of reactive enamine intermediates, YjgF/YER057c/UK114 family n=1 Tax=Acinetobacter boissieri TaxID=1219383 RepID=A0A1G6HK99_9GAMM|nr:Rid family hydrolase [Acinetobacter boissieri]SDB94583.1 Enamine deaminase RidA, house cleaning of reactive enamine intermediates, YjgF/YER057c/UK114 family [Acinetobacter boissieri]
MTQVIKVKTGSKFEDEYSYSRIVSVDNWIFVSNTAGRNPDTKEIPEDLVEQTKQVFKNIETALVRVDSSLEDVIAARIFVPNPKDTFVVMDIFGKQFKGIDPTITVTNSPLVASYYKVEVEVTAYRNASKAEIKKLTF